MQDQQERQYHRNYSKLQWQPLELHDELRSIENWLGCAQTQLAWLEKINAFSSMFGIRQDGPLAVINDFRLGCLPTVPMCWNEMNSAWGQTALLLLALSNIVGQEFQRVAPLSGRGPSKVGELGACLHQRTGTQLHREKRKRTRGPMCEIRARGSALAASAACLGPCSPGFVRKVIQNVIWKDVQKFILCMVDGNTLPAFATWHPKTILVSCLQFHRLLQHPVGSPAKYPR
ncbi:hypothetical protein QTO34_013950 [Cnephaeus nilssonii]|uniref:Atg6 BARA domain-containing protein n=1 Tax=Cnephaeus nilssonii TaxID=3371016 RepID=A0AA40LTH7_CNENI|nr:hypothetical protein QTO34_013950 [Eptesicus nilssonii]